MSSAPQPIDDPLDTVAGVHARADQVACWGESPDLPSVGIVYCQLPLLHAGDHVCGPYRWRRRFAGRFG